MLSKHLPPWKRGYSRRPNDAEPAQAGERSVCSGVEDKDYDVLCLANETLQAEVRRLRKAIRMMAVPVVSQADAETQTGYLRLPVDSQSVATQTDASEAPSIYPPEKQFGNAGSSMWSSAWKDLNDRQGAPATTGRMRWADQFEDEPLG